MHSKRLNGLDRMLSMEALLAVKACMQAAHAGVLQYSTSVLLSTSTTALNRYVTDTYSCNVHLVSEC